MLHLAEFRIPARGLPGGQTLAEMPDYRIEIERIVPTGEYAMPFFWVWGRDPEAFLTRAETEPEIADVRMLERVEGGALFRVRWTPEAELVAGIERLDLTIASAIGTGDEWRVRLRFRDRSTVTAFRQLFDDHGITVRLHRLYDLAEAVDDEVPSLTAEQRETLLVALDRGYFDEPRRVTQSELGEHFGVSARAVSERLRRGTGNLVRGCLRASADDPVAGSGT